MTELRQALVKLALNLPMPMAAPTAPPEHMVAQPQQGVPNQPKPPQVSVSIGGKPNQPGQGLSGGGFSVPSVPTPGGGQKTAAKRHSSVLTWGIADELDKLGAMLKAADILRPGISYEEAQSALARLRKLERERTSPEQALTRAATGAAVMPGFSMARRAIVGDNLFGLKPVEVEAPKAAPARSALTPAARVRARAVSPRASSGIRMRAPAPIGPAAKTVVKELPKLFSRKGMVQAGRDLAGSALMGGVFAGALPIIHSTTQREYEKKKLRDYLSGKKRTTLRGKIRSVLGRD
jgi:hypothetical protein